MSKYKAGDSVWLFLDGVGKGIGHVLSGADADALNQPDFRGMLPTGWRVSDGDRVVKATSTMCYFPDHISTGLAWSVKDTTCTACLQQRAWTLRGWRWTHEHNADEVAFLKSKLGDAVAGYADLEPEIPDPYSLDEPDRTA